MFAVVLIGAVLFFLVVRRLGGPTKTIARMAEAPRQAAEVAPAVVAQVAETSNNVASTSKDAASFLGDVAKDGAVKAIEVATKARKDAKVRFNTFRTDITTERNKIRNKRIV